MSFPIAHRIASPSLPRLAMGLLAAAVLAGCANRAVDAQWSDPQLAGSPLQGARVMVVCEAAEVVVARICGERLAATLQERGMNPVTAPDLPSPATGLPRDDGRYVTAARTLGASAVWATTVSAELFPEDRRSSVSIGFGGFGFGGGHSGGGVGVGVSMPVGGGGSTLATPQYAADARVTEVTRGRLLWTARAGSPPSTDVRGQVDSLVQRLVAAAGDAGVF